MISLIRSRGYGYINRGIAARWRHNPRPPSFQESRMRLFIALNLSDGAKEGVYDAARPPQRGRLAGAVAGSRNVSPDPQVPGGIHIRTLRRACRR